jgi:predicted RNA polymerase sigma factor
MAAFSEEALRLGRMLGQLLPGESEVHALVALMELQASRNAARRGKNGEAVLLPDQNRCPGKHSGIPHASLYDPKELVRWFARWV